MALLELLSSAILLIGAPQHHKGACAPVVESPQYLTDCKPLKGREKFECLRKVAKTDQEKYSACLERMERGKKFREICKAPIETCRTSARKDKYSCVLKEAKNLKLPDCEKEVTERIEQYKKRR